MLEPYMIPSLRIHILQQLWKEVTQEIVVSRRGVKKLSTRNLSPAMPAWKHKVDNWSTLFRHKEAKT